MVLLSRPFFPCARCGLLSCGPPLRQGLGAAAGGRPGECAGGERCRPCSGPVAGTVVAAGGPGAGCREGGGGVPGCGGTRGGAGGGGAGGSLKQAAMIASNSTSTHC
jgi:hypothetical protein